MAWSATTRALSINAQRCLEAQHKLKVFSAFGRLLVCPHSSVNVFNAFKHRHEASKDGSRVLRSALRYLRSRRSGLIV